MTPIGERFRVGIPVEAPKIPQGWMLRTSLFDYPAAISPDSKEWIIDVDGVLHESRFCDVAKRRILTGKTQVAVPPFGTATVYLHLNGGPAV